MNTFENRNLLSRLLGFLLLLPLMLTTWILLAAWLEFESRFIYIGVGIVAVSDLAFSLFSFFMISKKMRQRREQATDAEKEREEEIPSFGKIFNHHIKRNLTGNFAGTLFITGFVLTFIAFYGKESSSLTIGVAFMLIEAGQQLGAIDQFYRCRKYGCRVLTLLLNAVAVIPLAAPILYFYPNVTGLYFVALLWFMGAVTGFLYFRERRNNNKLSSQS